MAETVGQIACPECKEVAALRIDARGKYFVNCDGCGRFVYNTRLGQERLLARAQSEKLTPEPEPESEPVPETVVVSKAAPDAGLIVIGIGAVIGIFSWLKIRK